MGDALIDPEVFSVILNGSAGTAAVHYLTASMTDLIEVSRSYHPASSMDLWKKYYRPPLENDGLLSESDFETRHYPQPSTLDSFVDANIKSVELDFETFRLVKTEDFESKQHACSRIENCSGWWQFSRIGYNADRSEAIVHTDFDHPKRGLMGFGHFVLLAKESEQWLVVAKHMTWIS